MISDLPVASVHGRDDWDWNERDVPHPSSGSAPPPRSGPSDRESRRNGSPTRRRNPSDRAGDHPAGEPSAPDGTARVPEVERLEAELERKEERLQHVIGRYERLLAEKNRRLDEEDRSDPADGSRWAVLSKVRNLLSRGR